jgi:hypothetical protein
MLGSIVTRDRNAIGRREFRSYAGRKTGIA